MSLWLFLASEFTPKSLLTIKHRKLSSVLRDDLDKWGGARDICIPTAGSRHCTAETNTDCNAIILQFQKKMI